jgi:hypothetical protein
MVMVVVNVIVVIIVIIVIVVIVVLERVRARVGPLQFWDDGFCHEGMKVLQVSLWICCTTILR